MIKKVLLIVLLIASLTACEPRGDKVLRPTPNVPLVASQGTFHGVVTLPDDGHSVIGFTGTCDDLENNFLHDSNVITEPCPFQASDGAWRLDISWDQDISMALYLCSDEDGGNFLPCIYVAKHPDKAEFRFVVFLP